MSKFPAITKDIPIPISLGLHLGLLSAVLWAGMQLQKLTATVEKQWSVNMEETAWDKFQALNSRSYPDMRFPDVRSIRDAHVGLPSKIIDIVSAWVGGES